MSQTGEIKRVDVKQKAKKIKGGKEKRRRDWNRIGGRNRKGNKNRQ